MERRKQQKSRYLQNLRLLRKETANTKRAEAEAKRAEAEAKQADSEAGAK
jgi:hypothetical protein